MYISAALWRRLRTSKDSVLSVVEGFDCWNHCRFIPKTFTDQLDDSLDSEHMASFSHAGMLRFVPSFKIQFAVSLNESRKENSVIQVTFCKTTHLELASIRLLSWI